MSNWAIESLTVSLLLATLVTVACRIGRLRPALCHLLWMIVLVRMVLPPMVAWPWTPGEIAQHMQTWWAAPQTAPTPQTPRLSETAAETFVLHGTAVPAPIPVPETPAPPALHLEKWIMPALGAFWTLGALSMALCQLVRLNRFRRLVRKGRPGPGWLNDLAASMAPRFGLTAPAVRVVPDIASPMTWGTGRAIILVPQTILEQIDTDRWQGVIAHELAHLKRRDHWAGWIELAVGCVCWWNPVFWYAAKRLHEYAELSCDAWTVWALPDHRRTYADTLIRAAELAASRPHPAPVLGMGHGPAVAFERRLLLIVREQVPCRLSWSGVAALLVLAALVTPSWSQTPPPASNATPAVAGAEMQKDNAAPQPAPSTPPQKAGDDVYFIGQNKPCAPLEKTLESPASLEFEDIHLNEICDFMTDSYDFNIALDWRAIQIPPTKTSKQPPRLDTQVTDGIIPYINILDVPIREILHALTRPLGLVFIVEPNLVWITSPAMLTLDEGRQRPEPDKPDKQIMNTLASPVSMEFENISLADITQFVSDSWNINIILDKRAVPPIPKQPKDSTAGNAPMPANDSYTVIPYIQLKNIPLSEALDTLLRPMNLVRVMRDNFVWITSYDYAFEPFAANQPVVPIPTAHLLAIKLNNEQRWQAEIRVGETTTPCKEGDTVSGFRVLHIDGLEGTIQLQRESDGSSRTLRIPQVKPPSFGDPVQNSAPATAPAAVQIEAPKYVLYKGFQLVYLNINGTGAWVLPGETVNGFEFKRLDPAEGKLHLVHQATGETIIKDIPKIPSLDKIPLARFEDGKWVTVTPENEKNFAASDDDSLPIALTRIAQSNGVPIRAQFLSDGNTTGWMRAGDRFEKYILVNIDPAAKTALLFDETTLRMLFLESPDTAETTESSLEPSAAKTLGESLLEEYEPFFKTANLPQEKEAQMRAMLLQYRTAAMALAFKGMLRNPNTDLDPQAEPAFILLNDELQNNLLKTLSSQEMDAWRDFQRAKPTTSTRETKRLDQLFPGMPPEKQSIAWQAMKDEFKKEGDPISALIDPNVLEQIWERMRARLTKDCTPEELLIVETFIRTIQQKASAHAPKAAQ